MKRIIKLTIFILILIALLMVFVRVFKFKSNDGIYQLTKFYEEEDNTIDVLFMGSSHMFVNANTSVLWDEYGIAGYNLGGSIQPFWNTYYYLKEAYKTQSPSLIVLDVFTASTYKEDYAKEENAVKNLFGLKLSKDKIEAVDASINEDARADYYAQYPVYHKRYSELTKSDFVTDYKNDYVDANCYKGETVFFASSPIPRPEEANVYDTAIEPLSDKNEEYLRKIVSLAREHGSQIVFILTPYYVLPGEMPRINRVFEIADELSVPYINYNLMYDEMGVDFENDYSDGCHMAYWGSAKFTRNLVSFMNEHCELPDRRGQSGYESYAEMVRAYKRITADYDIGRQKDCNNAISLLADDGYLTIVSAMGNYYEASNYEDVRNALLSKGIDIGSAGTDAICALDNGNCVFSEGINEEYFWKIAASRFDTVSITKKAAGTPVISVNTTDYSDMDNGIEIFVYDKKLARVACDICLAVEDGSLVIRK